MKFKTAIVTGASSGIGQATARLLAGNGLTVHALARRKDRLDQLADHANIVAHVLDMRDTHALEQAFGGLEADILVNNAGTGRGFSGVAEASAEDIEQTIGTNVAASLQLIRIVLPGMIARGRGHIVNIGSTAGLYPAASAVYGASKGAVRMLGPNLRLELRGTGIRVSEICPGRVTSEFYDAALDDTKRAAGIKASGITDLRPEDVADVIWYALAAPSHVNVSSVEIVPTEQTYGGMQMTPKRDDD
ncbi:MAG: SDR family oxidoreductase [Rhizobiaceae bacterium]